MTTYYKYDFSRSMFPDIEEILRTALTAVESLHGYDRVEMDLEYRLEPKKYTVSINGDTNVGRDLACIFTGLLRRNYISESFTIRRILRD